MIYQTMILVSQKIVVGVNKACFRNQEFGQYWPLCLARLIKDPACEIKRAPTSSPTRTVRFGAIACMRLFK